MLERKNKELEQEIPSNGKFHQTDQCKLGPFNSGEAGGAGVAGLETGGPQKMCHHDDDYDDHKNTPPHSWALNFNSCHILDPLMSNFAEISICPPPRTIQKQ